jgi:hypothetical protein
MTGISIMGALLRAEPDLLALVPEARIKAGRLPEGVDLPAIVVRTISVTERQPLSGADDEWERTTARISVTVRAASWAEKEAVVGLIRDKFRASRTGEIGGGTRVALRKAGLGPDVDGPGNTFEQTQDFRVSYDAPIQSDHRSTP